MSRRTHFKIIVVGIGTLAALVFPVTRRADSQSARAAQTTSSDILTYDAGFSRWISAPHIVEMSQGVSFQHDDASLKMDAAVVTLDAEQRALSAKSLSPIHFFDSQNDLTGQHGFVDFTRHLATLTDSIILTAKPGPKTSSPSPTSIRNRFKDVAVLTCEVMTYDYRRKIGTVPGALTIKQKGSVLTANSGKYDSKAQLVTLIGNVHGQDAGGNKLSGPSAQMFIKEGEETITLQGPLHGTFPIKSENDTADQSETPPPPTHSPAPFQP